MHVLAMDCHSTHHVLSNVFFWNLNVASLLHFFYSLIGTSESLQYDEDQMVSVWNGAARCLTAYEYSVDIFTVLFECAEKRK